MFVSGKIATLIDATIHFEPLPRLPATSTMLIRANLWSGFLMVGEAGDAPDKRKCCW
jgi:hypothetical protein